MDTLRTLILTPYMSIHRVVDWKDAVSALVTNKIDVLESYDAEVSSPSLTITLPSVARLKKMVSPFKKGVKFSRLNVYSRDGYQCQYCGQKLEPKNLNYDHVVPRVQGGKTTWNNVSTSCFPCNKKKGGRTPEQAGMRLLKKPYTPKFLPMTMPLILVQNIPDAWRPYLKVNENMKVG